MSHDPIRGKILRFQFADGPMAKKSFDHAFGEDGTVTFRQVGKAAEEKNSEAAKQDIRYELAAIRDDVYAVSYLSHGYTLTVILDFETKKLTAFSSNEKMLAAQHGTFESLAQSRPAAKDGEAGHMTR